MSEVQETLSAFIADELMEGDGNVGLDDNLLASGRVDSIGMMRLVAFIDEHFQISVPPEDVTIENFVSIQAIAKYIAQQDGHS